ncbi:unnamed protein product [Closterium sp. NIES-54]
MPPDYLARLLVQPHCRHDASVCRNDPRRRRHCQRHHRIFLVASLVALCASSPLPATVRADFIQPLPGLATTDDVALAETCEAVRGQWGRSCACGKGRDGGLGRDAPRPSAPLPSHPSPAFPFLHSFHPPRSSPFHILLISTPPSSLHPFPPFPPPLSSLSPPFLPSATNHSNIANPTLAVINASWANQKTPGGLKGSIPWDSLTALEHLQAVDLSGNSISGRPFTAAISKFTGLREM